MAWREQIFFVDGIQNIHAFTIVAVSGAEPCSTGLPGIMRRELLPRFGLACSLHTASAPNSHQAWLDSFCGQEL